MGILDNTVSALQGGIQNLAIQGASQNIEGWINALADQDFPGAERIVSNLQALHGHLQSGDINGATVVSLLSELGSDTQTAAGTATPDSAEQVQLLGRLLSDSAEGLKR